MKKNPLGAIAVIVAVAFPIAALKMVAAVAIFGAIGFGGAWLMDRYGDLPGGDRRCA
jgi:hypothetical protein